MDIIISNKQLSEAIQIWTGYKKEISPKRDDSRIYIKYGADIGSTILNKIKELENGFYSTNASKIAKNLGEMEKISIKDFRRKKPNLPLRISKAFAWCYTFDYK